MEIVIKAISSPDILDFANFEPEDKTNFYFLLELEIGLKAKTGADLFSIEVCTPKWLLENYKKGDVVFGRNRIFVFDYDINRIINEIESYIDKVSGNTWSEIANQISRIALWEFEDYKAH